MEKKDNLKNQNISSDKFKFIQKDEKIYDKALEGRPIGYLEDVWIRFRKNKTNLTASIILLLLIICSLTMPSLIGKEYERVNSQIALLPPRMPVIEKLGIFDGKMDIDNAPVDLESYDEERGVFLPLDYNHMAINMDTLVNDSIPSNETHPTVMYGQSVMRLNTNSNSMTVESEEFFQISKANNGVLEINIYDMPGADSELEVLVQTEFGGEYKVLDTLTEAGTHKIDVFDIYDDLHTDIVSKVRLRYNSDIPRSTIAIESVSLIDDSSDEPIIHNEGYELAVYSTVDGSGSYRRQNAERLVASFEYDRYAAAFDVAYRSAYPSQQYYAILEEWGEPEKIPNPDNPDGWFFPEGYPIVEVVKQNESVSVGEHEHYSYELYLDYATYLGYESTPYYLFGTTDAGRDLFSLVWVGLRTSLMLGTIVTLINVTIGILYGSVCGYYGGTVDLLLQRFQEVMGRLPWLVVLTMLMIHLGPGLSTLVLTMIITGWIGPASVTRMQFYRYKGREYVLASRTLGAKDSRLIFKHILPNGIGTIITSSILGIPLMIFTEAAISFLGFGIGHGQSFKFLGMEFSGVSIGVLLSDGRNYLLNYPHLVLFPAIIVSILMITFNMFGNALRDAFNPSLRGVE